MKKDDKPLFLDRLLSSPLFDRLKEIREENSWHRQTTHEHTLLVHQNLEAILAESNYPVNSKVLLAAALIHDMAKFDTIIKNPDGTTGFPSHDVLGAAYVTEAGALLGLDNNEIEVVKQLVVWHDLPHKLIDLILVKGNVRELHELAVKAAGDLLLSLYLLAWADMRGSNLQELNPELFRSREKIMAELIDLVRSK